MSRYTTILKQAFLSSLFLVLFFVNNRSFAQDGEALYNQNCKSCHKPLEDFMGPALQGARAREPKPDWVYQWVGHTTTMVETDSYAKALKARMGGTQMTPFPQLSHDQIKSILDWADAYKAPVATTGGGENGTTSGGEDNSLLYGVLTLVLALIALILLQVNSSLKKLSDEKEGIRRGEPVPFYRNKTYLMLLVLILFCVAGYYLINAAIGLGRLKGYKPEQPIFYSHKVHAGTNQISCLYCHGGAQDSKSANIPSVNICMNCHKAIKEYKGDPIYREDGKQVDGTAEIHKLYSYAGWNPTTKTYDQPGHPIEWVRIHSLPDHVYFNHSQHVKVGKQQCQTCHGPIQEMPQVYQFSELSMGWCINCHRTTKVDFYNPKDSTGNKYYSIFEKFHNDIEDGKLDSVTVEKMGGTECQKCHY
jgi:mono/diheme cytochrome c family protein